MNSIKKAGNRSLDQKQQARHGLVRIPCGSQVKLTCIFCCQITSLCKCTDRPPTKTISMENESKCSTCKTKLRDGKRNCDCVVVNSMKIGSKTRNLVEKFVHLREENEVTEPFATKNKPDKPKEHYSKAHQKLGPSDLNKTVKRKGFETCSEESEFNPKIKQWLPSGIQTRVQKRLENKVLSSPFEDSTNQVENPHGEIFRFDDDENITNSENTTNSNTGSKISISSDKHSSPEDTIQKLISDLNVVKSMNVKLLKKNSKLKDEVKKVNEENTEQKIQLQSTIDKLNTKIKELEDENDALQRIILKVH